MITVFAVQVMQKLLSIYWEHSKHLRGTSLDKMVICITKFCVLSLEV